MLININSEIALLMVLNVRVYLMVNVRVYTYCSCVYINCNLCINWKPCQKCFNALTKQEGREGGNSI